MTSHKDNLIEAAIKDLLLKKLTALDRAAYLSAWRDIYETANMVDRRGGDRRSTGAKEAFQPRTKRFTLAAAEAMGLSETTVQDSLRAVANIPETIRATIGDQPIADNMSELLRLASESVDRQQRIVELMFGPEPFAATVTEAIDAIDGKRKRRRASAPASVLKEWLSPSEIADLGLIGHLNSKRAVNAWIKAAKPFEDDGMVRLRLGTGGGYEYHVFALLPYVTDDAAKARIGAMLGERMILKQRFDSFSAAELDDTPVPSEALVIDLGKVPTDDLVNELMKRAGLIQPNRGTP